MVTLGCLRAAQSTEEIEEDPPPSTSWLPSCVVPLAVLDKAFSPGSDALGACPSFLRSLLSSSFRASSLPVHEVPLSVLLRDLGPEVTADGNLSRLSALLSEFPDITEDEVAKCVGMMCSDVPASRPDDLKVSLLRLYELVGLKEIETALQVDEVFQSEGVLLEWNPKTFSTALRNRKSCPALSMELVLKKLDYPEFACRDTRAFVLICSAVIYYTQERTIPADAFLGNWSNGSAQLALISFAVSNPSIASFGSAATVGRLESFMDAVSPDTSYPFRSSFLVETLLDLDARALLREPATKCPEILVMALALARPRQRAGVDLRKGLAISLLQGIISQFPSPKSIAAIRGVWKVDEAIVASSFVSFWKSKGDILQLLQVSKELENLQKVLQRAVPVGFAMELAIRANRNQDLDLAVWLAEALTTRGDDFADSLVQWLRESKDLTADETEMVVTALQNYGRVPDLVMSSAERSGTVSKSAGSVVEASSVFAEEACKKLEALYDGSITSEEIVQMMQTFQNAGEDSHEYNIYRCMVNSLFDEYKFLQDYPDQQLRVCGKLFGSLVQRKVFDGPSLGLALLYILSALETTEPEPTVVGKRTKFGLCALEMFQSRISEFPNYASKVVQIPRLFILAPSLMNSLRQTTLGRKIIGPGGLVAPSEIERSIGIADSADSISPASLTSMTQTNLSKSTPTKFTVEEVEQTGTPTKQDVTSAQDLGAPPSGPYVRPPRPLEDVVSNDSSIKSLSSASTSRPEITRAVTSEELMDKFHFIFNNLSANNITAKERELMEFLDPSSYDHLVHYIVVKRASIEPNFHDLYISFLDRLAPHIPNLISDILLLSYSNVHVCLNSLEVLSRTSSNERTILKSLGTWIGNLTLARDRPILRKHLDLHRLIYEAYSNGRLIAVLPFISKLIEPASRSRIFKANNPWTRSLLRLLKELYLLQDLKINLKFEVPLLYKKFDVDLNDIPPSNILHSLRQPDKAVSSDFYRNNGQQMTSSPIRSSASPSSSPSTGPGIGVHSPQSHPQSRPQSHSLAHSQSLSLAHSQTQAKVQAHPRAQVQTAQGQAAQLPDVQAQVQAQVQGMVGGGGLAGFSLSGPGVGGVGNGANLFNDRVPVSTVGTGSVPLAASSSSTVIPNLAQHLNINGSLPLLQASPGLKALLPLAVDRAVREIISPVVERSCTIACITTREMIVKDLGVAGPGEVTKFRRSAAQMAQQLAGSLALVTCKEPLRVSMSNHLRSLLSASAPHGLHLVEQTVSTVTTNNLSVGCAIIERAANEKVTKDIDEIVRSALAGGVGTGVRGIGEISEAAWRVYEEFGSKKAEKWLVDIVLEKFRGAYVKLRYLLASSIEAGVESTSAILKLVATMLAYVQRAEHVEEAALILGKDVFESMFEGEKGLYHQIHMELLRGLRALAPSIGRTLVSWMREGESHKRWNRNIAVTLLSASDLIDRQAWDDMVSHAIELHCFPKRQTNPLSQYLLNTNEVGDASRETTSQASELSAKAQTIIEYAIYVVRVAIVESRSFPASEISGVIESLARLSGADAPPLSFVEAGELYKLVAAAHSTVPKPAAAALRSGGPQDSVNTAQAPLRTIGGQSDVVAQSGVPSPDNLRAGELGVREKVTSMLSEWERVVNIGGSSLSEFVGRVSTVLEPEAAKEQFFRHSIEMTCDQAEKALIIRKHSVFGDSKAEWIYPFSGVDSVAKFFVLLCRYEHAKASGRGFDLSCLGVLLDCLVRIILKSRGDLRPQHRLFSNVVFELSIGSPPADSKDSSRKNAASGDTVGGSGSVPSSMLNLSDFGVLSRISGALDACGPRKAPAFAYSWLQIMSHKNILPRLLMSKHNKGWLLFKKLLVDLLAFLAPHLYPGKIKLSNAIRALYKGTLRVLLVLLHDFPEFLCDYHFALCDVIPPNCIQLRNLVLSAFPKSMRLPDPFLPDLDVDSLPDMATSPRVMANYTGTLNALGIRGFVDACLGNAAFWSKATVLNIRTKLMFETRDESAKQASPAGLSKSKSEGIYNVAAINALVLYIGQHAISLGQNPGSGLHTSLLQAVISELDGEGRYHLFNAVANQLRYPNNHTRYFSRTLLYLFRNADTEALQEQITRVLVERLIAQRPHPWGLLITFIELIKNPAYSFWSHDFVRCAHQIQKLFKNVAQSCNAGPPTSTINVPPVHG